MLCLGLHCYWRTWTCRYEGLLEPLFSLLTSSFSNWIHRKYSQGDWTNKWTGESNRVFPLPLFDLTLEDQYGFLFSLNYFFSWMFCCVPCIQVCIYMGGCMCESTWVYAYMGRKRERFSLRNWLMWFWRLASLKFAGSLGTQGRVDSVAEVQRQSEGRIPSSSRN